MVDINFHHLQGMDGKHYILPTYLENIYGLNRFMQQVLYTDELYDTPYVTATGKSMRTTSALGKHAKHLANYSRLYSKNYQFAPEKQFFFEQYRAHPISTYHLTLIGERDKDGIASFDDFVTSMRKNAVTSKLKKRINDWQSKSKKNLKRLEKLQRQLFDDTACVLAVRIDCYLHKALFTPAEIDQVILEAMMQKEHDQIDYWSGNDISQPRIMEGRVSLKQLQRDRKRLFVNMKSKPSLFKHAIGYVWRIECGRKGGYHLHLMLFYNGSDVQCHQYIAQEVGKYWQDVITDGRGYFNNCNLERSKHRDRWALGKIHHWDSVKRSNLNEYLTYFCKTNQLVQVVPYAGCHLFGCGFFHRRRKGQGGRPRMRGMNSIEPSTYVPV